MCLDRRGIFVFSDDHVFESLRFFKKHYGDFSRNIMAPFKIPTHTPAPDRGGLVAVPGVSVAFFLFLVVVLIISRIGISKM